MGGRTWRGEPELRGCGPFPAAVPPPILILLPWAAEPGGVRAIRGRELNATLYSDTLYEEIDQIIC